MGRLRTHVLAGGAAALVLGLAGCSSGGGGVDPSTAEGRRETATQLARATQAQKLCFGWHLTEGSTGNVVSQGSNLGDGKPASADAGRCPRWVEVRAAYYYTAESSESDDYAAFDVQTSPDLTVGPAIRRNMDRFGLTEQSFVDDPTWAISRAALALPLLAAEAGAAEPASPPSAPAANPRALEPAGSDFWRDRTVFVAFAALALALAVLALVVGLVQRARLRRRRVAPPRLG
jgi:hypothetical protein